MNAAEIQAFAQALYDRRGEGVLLRRATVTIELPDSARVWHPKLHMCYQNAEIWVRHNPNYRVVYGYVYHRPDGESQDVLFQPHAVIENERGDLVDITPHDAEADHPFIRHTGTLEQFDDFAESNPEIGIYFTPR